MIRLAITILALFFLSGCSGERCIEADDFGFATFTAPAYYDKSELSEQYGAKQVAPWIDSGYRVNGRPLTILVKSWEQGKEANSATELSAWCAWYGANSEQKQILSSICEKLQDCRFVDDQMCTNTKDARISNAPCIFRNGVGLYALITEENDDPNISLSSRLNPRGLSFHLGTPTVGYEMLDVDKTGQTRKAGGRVYKYEDSGSDPETLKEQYHNGNLYFKILDKFYDDNTGQYRVVIKSGVTYDNFDPVGYVTKLVKEFLFGIDGDYGLIRSLYNNIINNPGYRIAVAALLSLYIMFTAFSYLSGNLELTQTELVVRILKIALIAALLSSEYSWSFFYDYLFVYFIYGVEQILRILTEAGATGPGSSGILGMMLAPQTTAKLMSLLFVDWRGFIYIALFFIALTFIAVIFFQAAVIYLTALIAIGFIISLGPIFICFMLFETTKRLFENWFKQLVSYAIQPIILFTGLIFISIILRQEIYSSLGFKVCKQSFFRMDGTGNLYSNEAKDTLDPDMFDSLFYWWFPKPMKGEQFTRTKSRIPIPIDHFTGSDNSVLGNSNDGSDFCEAYACIGDRYVDLPFLDPEKDAGRIQEFWNGNFVQFDRLMLVFIALYLLYKFNGLAVSTSMFITDTSGNLTSVTKVTNSMQKDMAKTIGGAQKLAGKGKSLLARTPAGRSLSNLRKKVSQAPSKAFDNARVKILKKQALNKPLPFSGQKSILAEVKKKTGLEQKNIRKGATKDYKNALSSRLRELDPGMSKRKANRLAGGFADKNFGDLNNEFSKVKYGKEYDNLSTSEQKTIDNAFRKDTNQSSLYELAKDSRAEREFREAYVDAYQGLSDRGVGFFGKRSKALRTLQEVNHDYNEKNKK